MVKKRKAKRKVKKKVKRKKVVRRKKRKVVKKKKKGGSKKAFGGYTINFKGCGDTVEKVFGTKPIAPSQMTKKLWIYVKRKRLSKR